MTSDFYAVYVIGFSFLFLKHPVMLWKMATFFREDAKFRFFPDLRGQLHER